jgi:hypothetical protein
MYEEGLRYTVNVYGIYINIKGVLPGYC